MKQLPATKLTANDATAKEELGRVRWEGGKAYRYILKEDATAIGVGDVVEFSDTTGYEVTSDRSGGASIGRVVAGVAIGTITDDYYGWVQVSGRCATIKTDGGVSAGDTLIPHASVDGRADTGTTASTVVITVGQKFAMALEADDGTTTAGTCAGMIMCL
jgi:hypothetical protein